MSMKIRQSCFELMTKPELLSLATIDSGGYPHIRALANLRGLPLYASLKSFFHAQHPFRILLTTHSRSKKIQQIRLNPRASVYFIVPHEFHSLMLLGDLKRIKDPEIEVILWQKGWEQFYPDGPSGKTFAVFQLDPFYARGWFKNKPFVFKIRPEKSK